ncbi:MAG: MTH1187 family thiamine-binding protein [bacterium]
MAEFSVVPLDKGESVGEWIAEVVKLVHESGISYQFTPMATIVEGEMDDVMELITSCHRKMRESSGRVITNVKIDDRQGAEDRLRGKVETVEKRLGHELNK